MAGWMLYVHALSPIHSGTGAAAGVVDLPVARERVTTWPYLPGSGIKGVLRDAADNVAAAAGDPTLQTAARQAARAIFGPDTEHADEGAGSVWFADAHLLCLPVRSFKGTFAWVTCRLALERWQRDHQGLGRSATLTLPAAPADGRARLADTAALTYTETEGQTTKIALEDLDFTVEAPDDATVVAATAIADAVFPERDADGTRAWWHGEFVKRFAVIADDEFTQLAAIATEIVARIRLDEQSKTVAGGALWYEESVPAEAIFSAPLGIDPRRQSAATAFKTALDLLVAVPGLQIGGHAGVGRGLVRLRLA